MPDSHRLQADDRDPDHIIRDQQDRIEELEAAIREHREVVEGTYNTGEASDRRLWSVLTRN